MNWIELNWLVRVYVDIWNSKKKTILKLNISSYKIIKITKFHHLAKNKHKRYLLTKKIRYSFTRVLTRASLMIDGMAFLKVAEPVMPWSTDRLRCRSPIPNPNHLLVALDLPLPRRAARQSAVSTIFGPSTVSYFIPFITVNPAFTFHTNWHALVFCLYRDFVSETCKLYETGAVEQNNRTHFSPIKV